MDICLKYQLRRLAMERKIIVALLIGLVVAGISFAEQFEEGSEYYKNGKHYYIPKAGFVPDEATAIRIAEAVWLPIYGKDIYEEKPFIVGLRDGVWTVTGSLPGGRKGGVAEVEISKEDGRILRVSHGE